MFEKSSWCAHAHTISRQHTINEQVSLKDNKMKNKILSEQFKNLIEKDELLTQEYRTNMKNIAFKKFNKGP